MEFSLPQGGLAIWIRFAEGLDPVAIAAAAEARGVGFMPGAAFFSGGLAPVNGARLGFASMNEAELVEAVECLAGAVKATS